MTFHLRTLIDGQFGYGGLICLLALVSVTCLLFLHWSVFLFLLPDIMEAAFFPFFFFFLSSLGYGVVYTVTEQLSTSAFECMRIVLLHTSCCASL